MEPERVVRAVSRRLHAAAKTAEARITPARVRARQFDRIYRTEGWGQGLVSVSGSGSDLEQTARITVEIPALLGRLDAQSLLDAPCGDLYWMSRCDLGSVRYTGMDIVPELIDRNALAFPERSFLVGDVVKDPLPPADLILCRDCLVHLRMSEIFQAIRNMQSSTYLLTTTFPETTDNREIARHGQWRPLNLQTSPFDFPEPLELINEGCTEEGWPDKSLGLWRLSDLR